MRFFVFASLIVCATATTGKLFANLLLDTLVDFRNMAESELISSGSDFAPSPDYPYFNFIPQYVNTLPLKGTPIQWTSPCFSKNIATIQRTADGTQFLIKITASGVLSDKVCEDTYFSMSTSMVKDFTVISAGPLPVVTKEVYMDIPADLTDSEAWDLEKKGVRLFRFFTSHATSLSNLIRTVDLFIPEFISYVPESVALNNIDFLKKYTTKEIVARDASTSLPPDESEVHSGDFFGLMRMDGLNPMLAWAMGSSTGHTTIALWIDGELYVCESTTASAYWPTDGIQKTPYRQWLKQADAADFQVVWAPLTAEARAHFNETAAVEFFRANEGFEYGFKTMLWGWIDTQKDNFPCIPPDFSSACLQWEFLEPLLAFVDRKIPPIGEKMWNSGVAMRLGVSDKLRTSDLYKLASDRGMTVLEVVTMPEQDSWVYNTTRYEEPAVGKNMVCCVLVCNVWKAAGVFGELSEDIQCGEQTNWDDYVLTILDDSRRQIIGDYTLELNDYRSKTPYAHMGESCASLPPTYNKSPTC